MGPVVLSIVGALLLAACQADSSASASPDAAEHTGGTLRVGLVHFRENYPRGEAPGPTFDGGLDPAESLGPQVELFRCCLTRTLVSYVGRPTAEGGSSLEPDLAVALPDVSDDGLTWTFHLQHGLRYAPPLQDVEITVGDVIRAIERALTPTPPDIAAMPFSHPRIGNGWYVYEDLISGAHAFADGRSTSIAGLEAPDPYTLQVHVNAATGDLPYLFALAMSAPIPPNPDDPLARLGVAAGHDRGYGPYLVSSGPYMLEGADKLDFSVPAAQQRPPSGYRPEAAFTFVRNPSWNAATDGLRPAYADRIEFSVFDSDEAAGRAVEAGDIDLAYDVSATADQVAHYSADEALRAHLIVEPNDVVFLVLMNVAARPLDDIHVRKALNFVIDKAEIQGLGASEPPRFAGPTGGHVAGHIVPDGLENDLLAGYDPYQREDDKGGLAAAKAEMARSPYDSDGDGVCDAPECRGIVALVRNDEPFWKSMAASIADRAREIGVEFDRQEVEVRELFSRSFDPRERVPIAFGIRFNKDYPTAAGVLPGLFSGEGLQQSGNASLLGATPQQLADWGYDVDLVPSVDDRIAVCGAEIRDPVECWARLDQYLMEEIAPVLPLLFGETAWITSDRVAEASFAQSTAWPALDRFVVVGSTP